MRNNSVETGKILEYIALKIRDDVSSLDSRRFRPPSPDAKFGECGYAARVTSKQLRKVFEPERVKIYSIQEGYHIVTILGDDFQRGWKIDPTIGQFEVKDKNKMVFAPHEKYIFNHREASLIYNLYFM